MARAPEDRTTTTTTTTAEHGTRVEDRTRVDDATLRPNARSAEPTRTEVKKHKGGSTLWIVLAVVAALILAFYLFSGAFATGDDVLDTGVQVAPADGTGGTVTTTDPDVVVVPEGTTVDGTAPVVTD